MQKISQNGTMFQQMLMMQQQMLRMAQIIDPAMAEQVAMGITGGAVPAPMIGGAPAEAHGGAGGEEGKAESSVTKNARKRVADSTSPT